MSQTKYIRKRQFVVQLTMHQREELEQLDHLSDRLEQMPFDSCVRFHDKYLFTGEKYLSLRNGMDSFRKKLGLSTSPVMLDIHGKLPFAFYDMIPESVLDTEEVEVWGNVTKDNIRSEIRNVNARMVNKRQAEAVLEDGVMECYKSGIISATQYSGHQRAAEEIKNKAEEDEKLKLDLPRGHGFLFRVKQTGKLVAITSYKDEGAPSEVKPLPIVTLESGLICKAMLDDTEDEFEVKRKHYFMYSTVSGYGKTTIKRRMVHKYLNACWVNDLKNFAGVRKNAQFLCIDEFGARAKISFEQLKTLTGGSPDAFEGNMKTFGKSFTPRGDAQIIMASNKHLFQCVGSVYDRHTRRRTMPWKEAKQLFDRFHIIRFDDEKEYELCHGASLISVHDDHYEPYEETTFTEFMWDHRELCSQYLAILNKLVKLPEEEIGAIEELERRYKSNLMRYHSWYAERGIAYDHEEAISTFESMDCE